MAVSFLAHRRTLTAIVIVVLVVCVLLKSFNVVASDSARLVELLVEFASRRDYDAKLLSLRSFEKDQSQSDTAKPLGHAQPQVDTANLPISTSKPPQHETGKPQKNGAEQHVVAALANDHDNSNLPREGRVAFVVPLGPSKDDFGRNLSQSFTQHMDDSHAVDLYFVYSNERDRTSSKVLERFKYGLPTLVEMAGHDKHSNFNAATFRQKVSQSRGGVSPQLGSHRIADIKELYAIRALCQSSTKSSDSKLKYKHVAIFDSETLIVRSPPTRQQNFVALLDAIYAKRTFYSGTAKAGKSCMDDWMQRSGDWMQDSGVSQTLPSGRSYHDWQQLTRQIGSTFWNELPFVACNDAEQFLKDIRFPPQLGGKYRWGFQFLQMVYHSWLWARRDFSPVRPPSTEVLTKECPNRWCGTGQLHRQCVEFPLHLLQHMGSLWMFHGLLHMRGATQWKETQVFMVFNLDWDAKG